MVKGYAFNDWDRAVLETYSLLLEYVKQDFYENLSLSVSEPMALYHNCLHIHPEACRFKTVDGKRLHQLEPNELCPELSVQRVIYQLSEYSQDERELAIKFVHYCHENGLNLKEPHMLQTLTSMMPLLLQHSCQEGPFAQRPMKNEALYQQVWSSMEETRDIRNLTYPLSDNDPDIRPILDSGIMNWIGRDDHDRPILIIDVTPERMCLAGIKRLSDARLRLMKAYLFCVEWARRHLFLPGKQESANVVLNIRGVDPLSVLMSNVRETVSVCSAIHSPNFLNKMWIVNDSYHWRTLWDVYRPMLPKSVQHKLIFLNDIEDIKELRLFKNKPEAPPTGNYPFRPFVEMGKHSEKDVKLFHDIYDNPKAMNSCPWILWKSDGYCQKPRCNECKTMSKIYPDIYLSLRNSYEEEGKVAAMGDPLLMEYTPISSSTTMSLIELPNQEDEYEIESSRPPVVAATIKDSAANDLLIPQIPSIVVARGVSVFGSEVGVESEYDELCSPTASLIGGGNHTKPFESCKQFDKTSGTAGTKPKNPFDNCNKLSKVASKDDVVPADDSVSFKGLSVWQRLAKRGRWMTYDQGHYLSPEGQSKTMVVEDVGTMKSPRYNPNRTTEELFRQRQKQKKRIGCSCGID